jgi:hypothetical protein
MRGNFQNQNRGGTEIGSAKSVSNQNKGNYLLLDLVREAKLSYPSSVGNFRKRGGTEIGGCFQIGFGFRILI